MKVLNLLRYLMRPYKVTLIFLGTIFLYSCGSGSPTDFPCNQYISFPETKQRVCNPDQLKRIEKAEHDKKVKQLCVILSAECLSKCATELETESCTKSNCRDYLICTSGIYLPPWMFR